MKDVEEHECGAAGLKTGGPSTDGSQKQSLGNEDIPEELNVSNFVICPKCRSKASFTHFDDVKHAFYKCSSYGRWHFADWIIPAGEGR